MSNQIVKKDFTFILDCYNANPDSMKASVEFCSEVECAGKKVFVLADMLELGDESEKAHKEIAELVEKSSADYVIFFGEEMSKAKSFVSSKKLDAISTSDENAVDFVAKKLKDFCIDKKILTRILKIGLPAGVQGSLFSFSNVIIQSSINSFGATVVAGNSAASNIEGFVFMAMNAFTQAIVAFVSQNLGAGKYERINKVVVITQLCVIFIGFNTLTVKISPKIQIFCKFGI